MSPFQDEIHAQGVRVQEYQCGQIIHLGPGNITFMLFHLNQADHRD